MTPAQPIVAGTKNISHIRKLAVVIRDGKVIDRTKLPTDPIMYRWSSQF